MENKRFQGKNLDGAITEACAELGIPSDKLRYKVVQEGSDGLFGLGIIGAKKYIIEIIDGKEDAADKKQPVQNRQDRDKAKSDRTKTERVKSDKPQSDNSKKPARAENVDNSEQRSARGEQRPSERRNNSNKDRAKDRPRRSDREQTGEERREANTARQDRRNADSKNKFSSKPVNANEAKPEAKADVKPERNPRRYEKTGEVTGDPVKTAEEFLTSLFKSMEMNISYRGEFKSENNELIVDLSGEDMGVLIGKRGQTLDALQYLTSQVVNKHQTAYIRVKIDTENYRERRRETMESLAQNIALKVKKTHKPVALEPMNPYERRIIHAYLQNDKDIITKSEGVEPYRHVIVCPVKKKKSYGPRTKDNVAEDAVSEELKLNEGMNDAALNVAESVVNESVQTAEFNITETETVNVQVEINESAALNESVSAADNAAAENADAVSKSVQDENSAQN